MTTKVKKIICLTMSICLLIGAGVMMTIATIKSMKLGKMDYSHNVKIVDVKAEDTVSNGVLYYIVSVEGELVNNTNKDYEMISAKIVFDGINNKTGQQITFDSIFVIDEFHKNTKCDMSGERFRVGNASGFIPESVKEIQITLDGKTEVVKFEEIGDSNLILFALALCSCFAAILVFAKWNNLRKKQN